MTTEEYQKKISQDMGKTLSEINDKYNTSYQGEYCCFGLTNILDKVFDWCNTYTRCTEFYNALVDKYKLDKIIFTEVCQGDLVFYDWDNSGDCDHIGIVYDVLSGGILRVLEYNRSGTGTSWKTNKVGYRDISITNATNYHCKFVKTNLLDDDITNDTSHLLSDTISTMQLIQLCLKSMGVYDGNCDGIAGEKTLNALMILSSTIKDSI